MNERTRQGLNESLVDAPLRGGGPALGGNLHSRPLARLLNVVFARLLELVAQARVLLHLAHEVLQRLELLEVAPPAMEATVALVAGRVLCAIFREVALAAPAQTAFLATLALAGLTALASAGIGACRRRTRTRASSSAATPRTLDHGPRLVVAGNCGAACCWAKTTRDAVVAAAVVDAGADVYADVYADEMLMLILMLMRMLVLSLVLVLVLMLC